MGRYVLSLSEMGGLTYDEVSNLLSMQDYLSEVEMRLDRDIAPSQRRSQLGNLRQCARLLDRLAAGLPDPQLGRWAACLRDRARACIFRVRGLIAFDQLLDAMQPTENIYK